MTSNNKKIHQKSINQNSIQTCLFTWIAWKMNFITFWHVLHLCHWNFIVYLHIIVHDLVSINVTFVTSNIMQVIKNIMSVSKCGYETKCSNCWSLFHNFTIFRYKSFLIYYILFVLCHIFHLYKYILFYLLYHCYADANKVFIHSGQITLTFVAFVLK